MPLVLQQNINKNKQKKSKICGKIKRKDGVRDEDEENTIVQEDNEYSMVEDNIKVSQMEFFLMKFGVIWDCVGLA